MPQPIDFCTTRPRRRPKPTSGAAPAKRTRKRKLPAAAVVVEPVVKKTAEPSTKPTIFCGRVKNDADPVRTMADLLKNRGRAFVFGPSGSGKRSLVMAAAEACGYRIKFVSDVKPSNVPAYFEEMPSIFDPRPVVIVFLHVDDMPVSVQTALLKYDTHRFACTSLTYVTKLAQKMDKFELEPLKPVDLVAVAKHHGIKVTKKHKAHGEMSNGNATTFLAIMRCCEYVESDPEWAAAFEAKYGKTPTEAMSGIGGLTASDVEHRGYFDIHKAHMLGQLRSISDDSELFYYEHNRGNGDCLMGGQGIDQHCTFARALSDVYVPTGGRVFGYEELIPRSAVVPATGRFVRAAPLKSRTREHEWPSILQRARLQQTIAGGAGIVSDADLFDRMTYLGHLWATDTDGNVIMDGRNPEFYYTPVTKEPDEKPKVFQNVKKKLRQHFGSAFVTQ